MITNIYLTIFALIFLGVFSVSNATATEVASESKTWVGFGFGAGYKNLGVMADLHFSRTKHDIAIYYRDTAYFLPDEESNAYLFFPESKNIREVGVVFSRRFTGPRSVRQFGAGLSLLSSEYDDIEYYDERDTVSRDDETGIGVPLNALFMWAPSRYFGLGLDTRILLSTVETYYNIGIKFAFGRVR